MLTIKSYIDESLFAGHDDDSLAKRTEVAIEIEKLKKHCYKETISDKYQISLGPKGYEIIGPNDIDAINRQESGWKDLFVILYNIDEKSLDHKISKFQGAMIVNSCEAKSMDWLFTDDCDFRGTLIIEWNDYLTSLRGCPESVDVFKCVYNPKLKSLAGAPKQCKKFVWYNNGDEKKPAKKIETEDIKKYLKTKNADILTVF